MSTRNPASGRRIDGSTVSRVGVEYPENVQVVGQWQDEPAVGCTPLDPKTLLKATPRSFAMRVRGQSMAQADIFDGDVVVGEFVPQVRPGAVVVALIDGEAVLKRVVMQQGQPRLVSESPNATEAVPLSEVVIQGVVHTVVRRLA